MKVLINRQVVNAPWGGGNNFIRAFRDIMPTLGHETVETLAHEPDVILLVGVDADSMGIDAWHVLEHRKRHPRCKVLMRLNDCDARKGTSQVDMTLWSIAKNCNGLVFVSRWLQEHLLRRWVEIEFGSEFMMRFTRDADKMMHHIASASVVHNGVDKILFHGPAKVEVQNRIKVVTHHWSDNPMKGQDVYQALDAIKFGVEFKYIGRHQCTFTNPHTKVVSPCWGDELARELSGNCVYVTGTRFDPGPNHCLEALACGLPVWAHKDGGGAVEFVGQDHIFDDLQQLNDMFSSVIRPDADMARRQRRYRPNAYVPMSWNECIARYAMLLEEAASR